MRTKRLLRVLAVASLGGATLLGVSASGASASTPKGGGITFYAPQQSDGIHGTIVITGAVGDYGTTTSIDKNGTADAKGNYVKITLQKGTFELNSTTANAKFSSVQPTVNNATCSALAAATGATVTVFDGTGLYKGISGTWTISLMFGAIFPRFTSGKTKGQCNESNSAQPLSQYAVITGSGSVSF
jgi:hypothetical protein